MEGKEGEGDTKIMYNKVGRVVSKQTELLDYIKEKQKQCLLEIKLIEGNASKINYFDMQSKDRRNKKGVE